MALYKFFKLLLLSYVSVAFALVAVVAGVITCAAYVMVWIVGAAEWALAPFWEWLFKRV